MEKKILVIGGGAAGMMAAISAARNGNNVTVIEKNAKVGRKIMITGKGRCNVTNNCDTDTLIKNVAVNARFLYSAFNAFNSQDTIDFFENAKVALKTERGNRVFPVSDKAADIVDALYFTAKKCGVQFENTAAQKIICDDGVVSGVQLNNGDTLYADAVVLATGGASYPVTGSTGDGYKMAVQLGHTITELRPSLVPIEIHEGFCSTLSGLSLKNVKLSVFEQGRARPVFCDMGEMLFTHFGVSGPLVLSASAVMRNIKNKEYRMFIDLKPALDTLALDKRIQRDFSENTNKFFINSLDKLLPKSLIPVIVKLSGIDAKTQVNQITREQRQKLCDVIKALPLTVTGFRPIEEAIVTGGGINIKEIDPKTMQSKLINNLYFAGEIIDVDAYTGGFNLQIAFSTGYLAGTSI